MCRTSPIAIALACGLVIWGSSHALGSQAALASEAIWLLPQGDALVRPAASEHELSREVRLWASPSSVFTPGLTLSLPMGARAAKIPVQVVKVQEGRVDAELLPSERSRGVLLQAPDKLAGIATQGRLSVVVTKKKVIFSALTHEILVGKAGSFRPLARGRMRIYERVTGRSRELALPKAPQLSARDPLRVALRGEVVSTLSSTAQGPLRLEVTDTHGELLGASRRIEAGAPILVRLPRAGTYYVAARELAEGDVGGALSPWLKLQVLGLAEGQAAPVKGTFLLDRGERVELLGTEGLQLRYGVSPDYLPASPSIGLSRHQATTVEFRDPASPASTAVLKLAPRVEHVDVELGPSDATWPGKALRLKVSLWDGAGRLMGLGKDLGIHVSVNGSELHPVWRLTKGGLKAEVPQQSGPGPWVLRLKVLDKSGRTITREILEIASR